jgi:hypothetical protein
MNMRVRRSSAVIAAAVRAAGDGDGEAGEDDCVAQALSESMPSAANNDLTGTPIELSGVRAWAATPASFFLRLKARSGTSGVKERE